MTKIFKSKNLSEIDGAGRILNAGIRRFFRLLFFTLILATSGSAQSFVFVSPNTRNHLTDEAALASQDSFEQQNFLAVERYLAAKLCRAPEIFATQGLDGPGSENSTMIAGCKREQTEYLGELLGRYAHQKWILVFHPGLNGKEKLFVISLPAGHPAELAEQMRKHGLEEGTIIAQEKQVRVYIWFKDKPLNDRVHAFADGNRGTIQEIAGQGLLLGDDDRARSQRIFDQRISAYERRHKVAFSLQLWSKKLHDMGPEKASPR